MQARSKITSWIYKVALPFAKSCQKKLFSNTMAFSKKISTSLFFIVLITLATAKSIDRQNYEDYGDEEVENVAVKHSAKSSHSSSSSHASSSSHSSSSSESNEDTDQSSQPEEESEQDEECDDKPKVSVQCDLKGDMDIYVDPNDNDGIIYIDGHKESHLCNKTFGQNDRTHLHIKYGNCGLHKNFTTSGASVISQKLIIRVNDGPSASFDSSKHISCEIPSLDDKGAGNFNTSVQAVEEPPHKEIAVKPTTTVNIHPKDLEKDLAVGDPIIVDYITTPKEYHAQLRNCHMNWTTNGEPMNLPVTDDRGCALRPNRFSGWTRDNSKHREYAVFQSFPTDHGVRVYCDITYCHESSCKPSHCDQGDQPRGCKTHHRRERKPKHN